MASIEQLIAQPAKVLGTASQTNALNTLTLAAPGTRTRYYITALCISGSAAPSAPAQATLTVNGVAVPLQIPAAQFAPIFINFAKAPLESDLNEQVALSCPALGASVISTVTLFGYKGSF